MEIKKTSVTFNVKQQNPVDEGQLCWCILSEGVKMSAENCMEQRLCAGCGSQKFEQTIIIENCCLSELVRHFLYVAGDTDFHFQNAVIINFPGNLVTD